MLKNIQEKYVNKETGQKVLKEGVEMIKEEVKSTIITFFVSLILKVLIFFALIGAIVFGYNYYVTQLIETAKTEITTSVKEKVEEGKAVTGAIVDKVNKDRDKISSMVDSVKQKSSSTLEEQKQKVNSIIEKNMIKEDKNETK